MTEQINQPLPKAYKVIEKATQESGFTMPRQIDRVSVADPSRFETWRPIPGTGNRDRFIHILDIRRNGYGRHACLHRPW